MFRALANFGEPGLQRRNTQQMENFSIPGIGIMRRPIGGFPKIKDTFLRVPIIRTIVLLGSTLESPHFGKLASITLNPLPISPKWGYLDKASDLSQGSIWCLGHILESPSH